MQNADLLGNIAGFSLHVGVSIKANQRDKLERLCRYISRPPVARHRLSMTPSRKICYQLKTPYRNGTTHVIFEPLDFISKLAALVPSLRVNLTRFHGVFVPNSRYRADVVIRKKLKKTMDREVQTTGEKQRAMNWPMRLKRVFNIDINICEACNGAVKVIACIDDPVVIGKILNYLEEKQAPFILPNTRAPPVNTLFN